MYDDSALDDFLKRFGDIRTQVSASSNTSMADNRQKASPLAIGANGVGISKKDSGLQIGADGVGEANKQFDIGVDGVAVNGEATKSGQGLLSGAGGAAGVASGVMNAAPAAVGLLGSVTGKGFDTSAEGGGVGKGGGAILKGGMEGAQLGMQVGGPWAAAIGAAAGAGGTALAHGKAKREYVENRKDFNLEEADKDRFQRAKEYAMSQGVGTMEMLKKVQQKKLGLIS